MAVRKEIIQVGDWCVCVKETGEVTMVRDTPKLLFTGKYIREGGICVFDIDASCRGAWINPDNYINRAYLLSWFSDHLDETVAGFDVFERGKRLIKRAFSGRPAAPA